MVARSASSSLLGIDAGVDDRRARVQVVIDVRVHVVAQAALLADLQEQPAAHAFAEHRVQHVEHVAVGMRRRQPRRGQTEVRLLGLLGAQPQARRVVRESAAGYQVPKWRGCQSPRYSPTRSTHLPVGDVAGHGDDRVLRHVELVHVADDVVARDGLDAVGRAAGVAAQRLVRPDDLVDQDVDDVGRAVLGHRQLFEDDLALFFELVRVQQRVEQAVGQDVERGGEAMVADLGPVDGQLFVGAGVHHAADAFDLFGDLAGGRSPAGALEQHVLEEVRRRRHHRRSRSASRRR